MRDNALNEERKQPAPLPGSPMRWLPHPAHSTARVATVATTLVATGLLAGAPLLAATTTSAIDPSLLEAAGKFPWLGKAITSIAYLKLASTLFEVRLQHWFADQLNEAAASADQDDDAFLRELFAHRAYRVTAFALRLFGFRLPTLADLERAVRLQREAVRAADGELRPTAS
jgi:hypothetical protein